MRRASCTGKVGHGAVLAVAVAYLVCASVPATAQSAQTTSSTPLAPNAEAPVLVIGGLCPTTRVSFQIRGKAATDRSTRRGLVAVPAYVPTRDSVLIVALVKSKVPCAKVKATTFRWDPVNGWAKPAGAPPRAGT